MLKIPSKIYFVTFLLSLIIPFQGISQKQDKFKVVLDAGHGGKDPGAVGNGVQEKDITLSLALKVGKILEQYKDIDVIFTRKTDVFITLNERPKIANRAKADVFISIHCNSFANPNSFGTETFVFGLTNNKSNLEVAKKENSVIFLEEDYQSTYQGFNPNNPQSIVGIMLLQDEYVNQSISLASFIQNDFTNGLKRNNRGVKQSSLWVLHQSAMPSVLIEVGFISNKKEVVYLKSDKGQNELAQSIAGAIINYKNEHYAYSKPFDYTTSTPEKPSQTVATNESINKNEPIFMIQISASSKNLPLKPQNFKGLNPMSSVKAGSLYKYYYGETNSYTTAQELLQQAKSKGYTDAFVVAFKDSKQVKVADVIN